MCCACQVGPGATIADSKEELAKALHKVVAYAKCMDKRGYDTFWMAEHHFQPEGTELIPNVLMMAMHLCGVTKNRE
jgi:alkanesulfonate monooxygenase SsuD/methylene tetrahydromethanopterin reductase-like flavin-dependent oxidoreductase (luciferase family)